MLRSLPAAARLRRLAALLFGLSLAAAALRLTACFVTPTPTNPHEEPDGDPPGDPKDDPSDASTDADTSEDPG